MSRRTTFSAGLVGVAAVAAAVVGGLGQPAGGQDAGGDDDRASDETPTVATATVDRRDLVEREELDGTLGYGESRQLAFGGQGTITALAPEGAVVEQGGTLGEVDGAPVPLLYGDRPMWRALGQPDAPEPSSDPMAPPPADPEPISDGPDIQQLEANLIAMGYATEDSLDADGHWTSATTNAVKRWQEDLGVPKTGRFELGQLVFAPGPLRIGSHAAEPGSPAGGPALTVTGTERLVDLDLSANRQGLLTNGQAVDVELPDGSVVPATVRSVSTVVETPDPMSGGSPTVAVVVVLDDPASSGALDQAPVDVQIVSVQASDALAIPVDALLALAEGGYALEQTDGSLVGVETGAFADGYVEVVPVAGGELAEGDEVVVPS